MKLLNKSLFVIISLIFISSASFAAFKQAAEEAPVQKPSGTLYDRLGGKNAIESVVADFVSRAAADPAVNFTRKGTKREWQATPENVGVLKKHLVQFISMATGGPEKYEGKEMKEAHQGMGISESEFNALANDLKISLSRFGVSDEDQDELMKIVGTTKGAIVEAPSAAPAAAEVTAAETAPDSFAGTVEAAPAENAAAAVETPASEQESVPAEQTATDKKEQTSL